MMLTVKLRVTLMKKKTAAMNSVITPEPDAM